MKISATFPGTARAVLASTAAVFLIPLSCGGATLSDPPLSMGADAIDPVGGPNGGSVDITVLATGAPAKDTLLAVPGMRVVQSFPGFEGAIVSQENRIVFTDPTLPEIVFTINAERGYGGCHATGAFTSGPLESMVAGEAIYIGDYMNSTAYSIEFSEPVAAAAFTIGREGETTGEPPQWVASFYGPDGELLESQSAAPGHGENVAALFGHIARSGTVIQRVVFGRVPAGPVFVMGNNKIFLDDLAFAPVAEIAPPVVEETAAPVEMASEAPPLAPDETPWMEPAPSPPDEHVEESEKIKDEAPAKREKKPKSSWQVRRRGGS